MNPQEPERRDLETALARALRQLGHLALDGGLLAQVWMPGEDDREAQEQSGITLQTKGLPYSILGPGDMLAIFRCLSCKYSFSADLAKQDAMGAPGRVFVSGEAETSEGKGLPESIYLRARDAEACRVSATLLLPIYTSPQRAKAAAVLEVTQFNSAGITYATVFEWARLAMEGVSLYTPAQIQTKTFEMQSHALSIRFFSSRNSALGSFFGMDSGSGILQSMQLPADMLTPSNLRSQAVFPDRSQARHSGTGHQSSGDLDGGADESPSTARASKGERETRGASSSRAALTKEDLEKHFGYGLSEAARRLGVCNTTLKRACRRLGVPKWPRRDLLKAARRQTLEQEAQRPLQGQTSLQGQTLLQPTLNLAAPNTSAAPPTSGPGLRPINTGSSPDFSFYTVQQTPAQASRPLGGEPNSYTVSSATNSLPSSGLLDRSCSSSLDAVQKTSTLQDHEGNVGATRDPLRMAIQGNQQHLSAPSFLAANSASSNDLFANLEGRAAMETPNQERFENLGLGDTLNLLGSIGTDIQDFNMLLEDGSFEWDKPFNVPESRKGD